MTRKDSTLTGLFFSGRSAKTALGRRESAEASTATGLEKETGAPRVTN